MKVGDLVIVASLGEIKAFRANPRTAEAEAGLKPEEVKLDLITAIDIVETHKIFSNQKLLIFTSSGRVFTINPKNLPSGKSSPKNFIYYVDSNMNDKLVKLYPYSDNLKCILSSSKGKGFIADLSTIQTSQKKGI